MRHAGNTQQVGDSGKHRHPGDCRHPPIRVSLFMKYEDEDEDELKLNSAQHARSAASRLDDVIVIILDRSALEQAREGLGGRDIEEPLIGLEVQKSTLEWCETVVSPLHM